MSIIEPKGRETASPDASRVEVHHRRCVQESQGGPMTEDHARSAPASAGSLEPGNQLFGLGLVRRSLGSQRQPAIGVDAKRSRVKQLTMKRRRSAPARASSQRDGSSPYIFWKSRAGSSLSALSTSRAQDRAVGKSHCGGKPAARTSDRLSAGSSCMSGRCRANPEELCGRALSGFHREYRRSEPAKLRRRPPTGAGRDSRGQPPLRHRLARGSAAVPAR